MALIITLDNTWENVDLVLNYMKSADRDNFSITAIERILDYYDSLEENVEFTPCEIDISWAEYNLDDEEGFKRFKSDYEYLNSAGHSFDNEEDEKHYFIDQLQEHTLVLSDDTSCLIFDYNF